ncbi:MAG TPA: tetratricopeptide repeat protein [Ktedonobacterales bacterium]|jgi:tetratricopeptide (TPR) repeat protein|nr:tetratricopeptide repeat protein [Ktedonobacterales bacterium]
MPEPLSQPDQIDALWNYDHPAESEDAFRRALEALDDQVDVALRLELLTQITRAQGLQRRFEGAHATLDMVEAQLDGSTPRVRIRYLLERGRVYNSSRQPERAQPYFVEAWELASTTGEDILAIDAAHMLAIIAPPEASLEWNQRALEIAERSIAPRALHWRGSLYNNIGWTYHDASDYEQALATFQQAAAARREEGNPALVRIAVWAEARTLRSLGRVEEALALQQELLRGFDTQGEQDGYVYEEIAECLAILGRDDEARPYFARAYETLSRDPWLMESESARLERLHTLGQVDRH